MRLPSRVRTALTDIVAGVNGNGEPPLAHVAAEGLVIALAEFEQRHIEPSAVLRALSEARMLARGSDAKAPTSSHMIGGQTCLALTIASRFLTGMPAGAVPLPRKN